MCGIAFAYRPDLELPALEQSMQRALTRLAHRGPDGHGCCCEAPWAIGHRRLAVIDLASSAQPLSDGSERFILSYNGELYNYRELRGRLASHWTFRTQGDVEVILAGLSLLGADFLALMEGMWALALWDRQDRNLLLVRDRMGQKPLYFQFDNDRFACASELPALHPLSWFAWQEDGRSTADYLRYGYYLPGTTAYRRVSEVLPGHLLRWRPGRPPAQQAYWRLSPGGFTGRRREGCQRLREALITGVRQRLVADVEVGALLSGGIDSSLVTAIIRRLLRRPLKTFTMGFGDASFDERTYARKMALACGTQHFEGYLDLDDTEDLIDLVLLRSGQPFADSSMLPTALLSQLTARHVKVALSGDGGDELFGGYQRYLARTLLRWYTRLPAELKKTARRTIGVFPEPGAHHSASLIKKAHLFVDASARMEDETPYIAPLAYSTVNLGRLLPDLCRQGHPPPMMPGESTLEDLQRMMVADALVYLPQDILAKVDRASMAFSLEVRSPFLDRRAVELAFAMPRQWHRWGFLGKRMLRNTFNDLLPSWVWRRRKHGFGVPLQRWFRSGMQSRLGDLLEETTSPLDRRFVRQMIAAHTAGRRDHGQRLWQLYIYLRWLGNKPWQSC